MNINKFILNFPQDTFRYNFIDKQFIKQNIKDYKIIEGINGHILNRHDYIINNNRQIYRSLKLGEIGCLLGHKKIYQYALDNKLSTILVLEDDVTICKDFQKELDNKYLNIPTDFDIVLLGSSKMWIKQYKENCILEDTNNHYYKLIQGHHYGCHIYLITEKAIKKILESNTITYPIDILVSQLNLNVYISKTQLAHPTRGLKSHTKQKLF